MAMTVDEALKQPGELIGAWETGAEGHEWLGIYVASELGVKLLGFERTDREGRQRRIAELERRGVHIGSTHGGEYVWAIVDRRDLVAWSLRARLFTANRSRVQVGPNGFPAADITCVTSWVDPSNLGRRGVGIERVREPPAVLVEEHDPTPSLDPTYDWSNVALDAAWARSLGMDLAAWLGVRHENHLP